MNDLAFLMRKKPYPIPACVRRHVMKSESNERHEAVRCKGCGKLRPVYEYVFNPGNKPLWNLCPDCRREKRKTS